MEGWRCESEILVCFGHRSLFTPREVVPFRSLFDRAFGLEEKKVYVRGEMIQF